MKEAQLLDDFTKGERSPEETIIAVVDIAGDFGKKVVDNLVEIYTGSRPLSTPGEKVYVTYAKEHSDGRIYSGRASGYGTPEEVVAQRDRSHHMKAKGFGDAALDKSAYGDEGKKAIRGREQQMIDVTGGAILDPNRRPGAVSANTIRGVSKFNRKGREYHEAATKEWGELYPYTGY